MIVTFHPSEILRVVHSTSTRLLPMLQIGSQATAYQDTIIHLASKSICAMCAISHFCQFQFCHILPSFAQFCQKTPKKWVEHRLRVFGYLVEKENGAGHKKSDLKWGFRSLGLGDGSGRSGVGNYRRECSPVDASVRTLRSRLCIVLIIRTVL